ncbi:MAG: SPFH domain-containing protein [Burkholderiaceae bacterium]
MSLGSFIKKQFIDIIQWAEQPPDVLMWRFPMADQEIQYGGSLTVREAQAAIFVNEGVVGDVFAPGMYKLTTQTLPVITYLKNWDKLFESPFKSDVYFVSTRQQIGRRWGTPQAISVRDKDFGMVRMRAFGLYAYRISDPKKFFTEIAGNRAQVDVDAMDEQLDGTVLSSLATAVGGSGVPFLDMAANQTVLAQAIAKEVQPAFEAMGLTLESFMIQSISLPEALQEALDKRIAMGMAGDLSAYTKFQTANAIPIAAGNEGGLAGLGAQVGVGAAIGAAMGQAMAVPGVMAAGAAAAVPAAAVPATVPAPVDTPEDRLGKLKGLLDKGLISQADFDSTKAEILRKLAG